MKCSACEHSVDRNELLRCILCKGTYHYMCLNITSEKFMGNYQKFKRSWKCPTYTNVTKRRSRNEDTPVKVNCGDSSPSEVINMSSDNMKANELPPSDIVHRGGKKQNTSTFSLEELGKLLDYKLDTKLQNTCHSLASEIEIKQEFNEVLMKLKSEFLKITESLTGEICDLKKRNKYTSRKSSNI
ncbi:unnamed protein product [Parnassius apollo]|uniref:(apollo) hypothetical protein n=1 Tax=Parnassius apollo TaxID=110799 RepID=A0A8S3XLN5_PARAO|nr:unnamed protein product [Parnassius apollo]